MLKINKFTQLFLWTSYIVLNILFTHQLLLSGSFEKQIKSIDELLKNGSENSIYLILIITTIFSILAFLIQFFIGKFLVVIFNLPLRVKITTVLIPKIVLLIINFIILISFSATPQLLFLISSFFASIMIFLLILFTNHPKNKLDFLPALFFSSPFIIDSLISLIKFF